MIRISRLTAVVLALLLSAPLALAQAKRPVLKMLHESGSLKSMLLERATSRAVGVRNADGQLTQRTTHSWTGSEWQEDTQTIFNYVGTTHKETLVYVWNGSAFEESARTLYDYGPTLTWPAIETNYVWEPGSGQFVPVDRTVYAFDESGQRVIGDEYSEWDASTESFVPVERTTYTYAFEWDLIAAGQTDSLVAGEWVPVYGFNFIELGEGMAYQERTWNGSEWVNVSRIIYPGTSLPEITDRLQTLAEQFETLGFSTLALLLPDARFQEWRGDAYVDTERNTTEYVYDFTTGAILQATTTFETFEEEWMEIMRYVTMYQMTGQTSRPIRSDIEMSFDGVNRIVFMREYLDYDVRGRISRITQQGFNGTGLEALMMTDFVWSNATVDNEHEPVPSRFALEPVYPNPFNPTARVTFRLDTPADATVRVYDALGREVATLASGAFGGGVHTLDFTADNLPSGTYIVRLEADGFVQSRQAVLLK